MKLDGYSASDISKQVGYSKAMVYLFLRSLAEEPKVYYDGHIYPVLAKWITDNGYTIAGMEQELGVGRGILYSRCVGINKMRDDLKQMLVNRTGIEEDVLFSEL